MKIPVNKELAKQILGRVIYLGSEPRYEYDNVKREYTDKMVSQVVNLACEKMEHDFSVQVETLAQVNIKKFAEVEMIGLEYDPTALVNTFNSADGPRSIGKLNERFRCTWINEAGKAGQNPPPKQG